MWWTWARARASTAGRSWRRARRRRSCSNHALAHRPVSGRAARASRCRKRAAGADRERMLHDRRRLRATTCKHVTLELPVGLFVCVTGVSGSGKSTLINDTLYHAVAQHLYGSSDEPAPYARDRRPGILRQGDQRRPEPDRAHAALQPGHLHRPVHADPRAVRQGAGIARARLRPGALLLQRQGRALRSLPGRRRDQGRDALPAGHLRALRRLPRPALQPRDPGDPVQGQEHPRGARR